MAIIFEVASKTKTYTLGENNVADVFVFVLNPVYLRISYNSEKHDNLSNISKDLS